MWTLRKDEDNNQVYLERDGEMIAVTKLEIGEAFYTMKVVSADGEQVTVSMKEFDVGNNCFSKKFKEDVKSRTRFFKRWQMIGTECIPSTEGSDESGNSFNEISSSPQVSSLDLVPDDALSTVDKKTSATGVTNDLLKKKLIGTFEVHISNFISPSHENKVRDVNYSHVTDLEKSFACNNLGQMTTLVGMVENDVTEEELKCQESVKVQILGGQHTVLALKSLLSKKLVKPLVRTIIYSNLDSSLALKVGLHHNFINEKSRPMSFIETVKMMRSRKPADKMTKVEIRNWKSDLLIIFGDKSLELMEGRLQNHIALARVGESIWREILAADEMYGDALQQTFFKDMLSMPEDTQMDLMKCLLDDGPKVFKGKIRDYRKQFPKRKRQRKADMPTVLDSADNTVIQDSADQAIMQEDAVQPEGLMETSSRKNAETYMQEIENLKKEVAMLRERLQREEETPENLEPNAKKARGDDCEEIAVGDHVMAYWANDDNMYEAVVLNIETVYSVQYVLDKKKKKLGREHIERCNS